MDELDDEPLDNIVDRREAIVAPPRQRSLPFDIHKTPKSNCRFRYQTSGGPAYNQAGAS
jgi:hypothetical protein